MSQLKLTLNNYYSPEANWAFFSNSQYKSFMCCEALTMAKLRGEWEDEDAVALLQGKYVHAWNEGVLEEFKKNNPEIFLKNGKELKAEFKTCDNVIEVIKNDELFMMALSGEKERLFSGTFAGAEWKILIDSYFPSERRFCDLKILKAIRDKFWNDEVRAYENVFEHRGYYTQVALYAEIERVANGRSENDYFEPFIAVATKEKYPDHEIISFACEEEPFPFFVERQLMEVAQNMPRLISVKNGSVEPKRCGNCDYCKKTKKLTGTTHYSRYAIY